jgi:hypothetical protein
MVAKHFSRCAGSFGLVYLCSGLVDGYAGISFVVIAVFLAILYSTMHDCDLHFLLRILAMLHLLLLNAASRRSSSRSELRDGTCVDPDR